MSAGQIFTGSGVDEVIITGSLVGDATVRLDNSGSSEEAADSITIGNISSGVVYGESGADTFNISGDARKATIYGGARTIPSPSADLCLLVLLKVVRVLTPSSVADVISSTVKGGVGADLFSASGSVSLGALYGNSGNDTSLTGCCNQRSSTYGGAGNDSVTIGGAANTLTYEGGVGADTIKIGGAINSTTIYGDNASAT